MDLVVLEKTWTTSCTLTGSPEELETNSPAPSSAATSPGSVATSGSPCKSFVTTLNEMTSRQKLTPVYQLISQEGMSHEPTFVYKVCVDGYEAIGKGRKKQEARQIAACNLLKKISQVQESPTKEVSCAEVVEHDIWNSAEDQVQGQLNSSLSQMKIEIHTRNLNLDFVDKNKQSSPDNVDLSTIPLPDLYSNIQPDTALEQSTGADKPGVIQEKSETEEKSASIIYPVPNCRAENPVGSLQELTLSIKWPPPRFELVDKHGVAHDAVFTISCYVWCYKSLGRGKSKKQAKREAAASMYEMLSISPEVKELWQKRSEMYAAKIGHKKATQKQATPKRAPPMQNFHKDLMNKQMESLDLLVTYSPEELGCLKNPLALLQDLANDLKFDILFEDLFDMSQPARSHTSTKLITSKTQPPLPTQEMDANEAAGALIILSLPREVVCFGLGSSKKSARSKAVVNALQYLRIASLRSHDGSFSPVQSV